MSSLAFEIHSLGILEGKTQDTPSYFDLFGPFSPNSMALCLLYKDEWLSEESRIEVIILPRLFSLGHGSKNSHAVSYGARVVGSRY